MSHSTLRRSARTTGRGIFQPAPGSKETQTEVILRNTPVTVKFRPTGEYDLLVTIEKMDGEVLQYVRRDVPRSAFELTHDAEADRASVCGERVTHKATGERGRVISDMGDTIAVVWDGICHTIPPRYVAVKDVQWQSADESALQAGANNA